MALFQVTVPYRPSYDYGIGADLATGSPMGKVVEGEISGVGNAAPGGGRRPWGCDEFYNHAHS
jgi:hypothetical protein